MSGVEFDRAGVAAHAKNLANKVKGGLEGSLKTLGVEVVDATGELAGANTVKAVETGKTFTAKDIILAPGSLPFVPPGVQVTDEAGNKLASKHSLSYIGFEIRVRRWCPFGVGSNDGGGWPSFVIPAGAMIGGGGKRS